MFTTLLVGLHHSVRKEDILKLKCQHGELIVQVCKELSEKVSANILHHQLFPGLCTYSCVLHALV